MKAIVIAAGKGSRLRPITEDKPKCLVEVGGKPILERQLGIFRKVGINDIAVIRGFQKEKINYPEVTYFDNDNYENNNILHSLFYARDFMDDGFICTYSDIVYGEDVVNKLIEHPDDICIVADVSWERAYVQRLKHPVTEAELVFINKDDNRVIRIGKDVVKPEEAHGEFIGLAKFSKGSLSAIIYEFNRLKGLYFGREAAPFQRAQEFIKSYLTDFFQELTERGYPVKVVGINGGWNEIDTDEDLERTCRYWRDR